MIFEDMHFPYSLLLSHVAWLFKVNCKTHELTKGMYLKLHKDRTAAKFME